MVRHLAVVLVAGLVWVTACEGPPGTKGDPGSDGTPCWQGLTDQNGDGVVDVQDCRGDDGTNGTNGTNGSNGSNGSDGLDCWDLNGNGAPDVATEDRNGDGVVDVDDCVGNNGTNGTNGVSNGTVNGTLTGDIGGPAEGVAVATVPDVGVTDTTDSAGQFTLVLPVGVYTIKLTSANYASKDLANVTVTAGGNINLTATLTANNPIVLTAPVASAPVGFGTAGVTLSVGVAGGTAPYTYAWSVKTAPTSVTLSSATAAAPTFTTGTLAAVLAGGKVIGVTGLARLGFVPVSAQQLVQMSYIFNVEVTDAEGFKKTSSVTIPPATLAQGISTVPRNQIVILNVPGNSTAIDFTAKPASSTAVLHEAATVNPWFIPDLAGDYTVAGLTVNAGDYKGSARDCGFCHGAAGTAAVDGAFDKWDNSAHGNHFFKYMEYDETGALVWKTDAAGSPIPAPTADEGTYWTEPGAMTTFEFGMTGAEGSHYGGNCIACHTTGYNLLASNNGFDDVAVANSWTFPNLKTVFGGDHATSAPNYAAWDLIPAPVKAYQGMQCESCHGPLGNHKAVAQGGIMPKGEYDTAACAVCHDKPNNHDRVALWKKSLHADLELAEEEATVEARGTSTSCYRCHGAQGFVEYLTTKESDPAGLTRPASLSQTGFGNCTPGAGYRGQYDPLDPACACKGGLTSSSSPVACPGGDADCTAAGGVCADMLNSDGTAVGPFCVKTTCNPKAIYCVPAAGHRVSGEDYDPACPCRPGVAVSNPPTTCLVNGDCGSGQICNAATGLTGQCVYEGCAADPAYFAYLSSLGLNKAEVQPISCAACHDPHATTLRVEGNTGLLGNGAEARGAGAGALCMVCHNTRNGARGDLVSTSSIGGPHAPVETDLFLGVNAYFMGAGGALSRHAAVSNTCAGCHVEMHPEEINPTNTNHTFEADGSICAECHGEAVNLEALEGQFLVSRDNLEKALATTFAKVFNTGSSSAPVYNYYVMAINPASFDSAGTACAATCAYDEVCDNVNETTPTCEKKVQLVNLTVVPASIIPSGRTANLKMTFAAAMQDPFAATGVTTKVLTANYQNVSSASTVKLDGMNLATPKFARAGVLAKANWNYWLVSSVTDNPAAQVVHNPSFVFDVLNATRAAVLGASSSTF